MKSRLERLSQRQMRINRTLLSQETNTRPSRCFISCTVQSIKHWGDCIRLIICVWQLWIRSSGYQQSSLPISTSVPWNIDFRQCFQSKGFLSSSCSSYWEGGDNKAARNVVVNNFLMRYYSNRYVKVTTQNSEKKTLKAHFLLKF